MPREKKWTQRFRSAMTGRYVSAKDAALSPSTTVKERARRVVKAAVTGRSPR